MRQLRYLQAVREGLIEEMQRDSRVFVMSEDVRVGTVGILDIAGGGDAGRS